MFTTNVKNTLCNDNIMAMFSFFFRENAEISTYVIKGSLGPFKIT